jgi:hypothetical protein
VLKKKDYLLPKFVKTGETIKFGLISERKHGHFRNLPMDHQKFYMFGAEFFFNLCILLIKANKS